jgi:hypothetical protein
VYSTSIDIYILGVLIALPYAVASLLMFRSDFSYVAASFIAIALASRAIVTPSRRKRHLELSEEQLDFLRRERSDFVSKRFRDIIVGWRSKGVGNG